MSWSWKFWVTIMSRNQSKFLLLGAHGLGLRINSTVIKLVSWISLLLFGIEIRNPIRVSSGIARPDLTSQRNCIFVMCPKTHTVPPLRRRAARGNQSIHTPIYSPPFFLVLFIPVDTSASTEFPNCLPTAFAHHGNLFYRSDASGVITKREKKKEPEIQRILPEREKDSGRVLNITR